MNTECRKRIIIERVAPCIDDAIYPVKRCQGESVRVEADIFSDGRDVINAVVLYRPVSAKKWRESTLVPFVNDRWEGSFRIEHTQDYIYTFRGWIDYFRTWKKDLAKKADAGQDIKVDLAIGQSFIEQVLKKAKGKDQKILQSQIQFIQSIQDASSVKALIADQDFEELMIRYADRSLATTYDKKLTVQVFRPAYGFSTWYEIFPRSTSGKPKRHGTFKDCERVLPDIAGMGFDVIYFPPHSSDWPKTP